MFNNLQNFVGDVDKHFQPKFITANKIEKETKGPDFEFSRMGKSKPKQFKQGEVIIRSN